MLAFKDVYFKSKILSPVATAQKVPHAYYKDHKLVFMFVKDAGIIHTVDGCPCACMYV